MSLNSYTWHAAAEVFCTADGKRLHPSHGSVFYRKEEIDAELARYNTAIEWCLQNSATHGRHWSNERQCFYPGITDQGGRPLQVPTALADLIVAVAGDNGEEETHS